MKTRISENKLLDMSEPLGKGPGKELYCYECNLYRETGATHTYEAIWVEPDGTTDNEIFHVCGDCLEAGNPDGPGYRTERCNHDNLRPS